MSRAREILKLLGLTLFQPEQEEAFYLNSRIKFIAGGEGSSKSFLGALYGMCRAIDDAVRLQTPILIWVVGEDFEDARKEIEYLLGGPDGFAWLEELSLLDRGRSSISKDERITLRTDLSKGLDITFDTISAYDPLKIAREQPHGIIGAEVSRWPVEVWKRCYSRLSRRHGWGIFSGSFEEKGGYESWFPEMVEVGQGGNELDLKSVVLPTWANLAMYPGGYDDPDIQQLLKFWGETRFNERFGGIASAPVDSVLPEFKSILHITEDAEYDEDEPVYLFADPAGSGDSFYAVLFVQLLEGEIRIVDSVYENGWTHDQIIQAAQMLPAWKGIARSGHVMDVAGSAEQMAGSSPIKAWAENPGISFIYQKRSIADQIDRLRSALAINPTTLRPYLQIHPRNKGLIAEGGGGPSPIPGISRWRMRAGIPEKKNNHAWQALAYGLLMHKGLLNPSRSNDGKLETYSYLAQPARSSNIVDSAPTGVTYLRRAHA